MRFDVWLTVKSRRFDIPPIEKRWQPACLRKSVGACRSFNDQLHNLTIVFPVSLGSRILGQEGFLHAVDDNFLVKKSWSVSNTFETPQRNFQNNELTKQMVSNQPDLQISGILLSEFLDHLLKKIIWILFGKISEIGLLSEILMLKLGQNDTLTSGPLAKVPHQRGQRQQSQVTWIMTCNSEQCHSSIL